jgi:hypothetical protein
MSILILLLLLVLGLSVYAFMWAFGNRKDQTARIRLLVRYIRSVALFALAFAVFSQILGLVDVFDYLARQDAGVSSAALAQAIRITFHPTELGLIIYLVSILATLVLKSRLSSLQSS